VSEKANRRGDLSGDDIALRRRLHGLLLFRLLLAIFFLLSTVFVQIRRDADLLSAHLQPLYFFSCILFLFTVVAGVCLNRVRKLERFAYLQLAFDVLAVTFLIFLSGGIDSLFSFLYMPVIISAAVLLYRKGSLLIASMSSISYGLLLDLQYFRWVSPLQAVGQSSYPRENGLYFHILSISVASFFLVAFLSGYLAEELQRSSEQLRRQEKDFLRLAALHGNIVQSVNSGLMTVSEAGHILFSNKAANEILGIASYQMDGQQFQRVFPGIDPSTWTARTSLSALQASSESNRRQVIYRRPSGEDLCIGYTVSTLQSVDESNSGWIFIFQDLTHLKAMEENVQRMERLAFAGKMAAEIAHEIKNPLAAMSGAVQMLQVETNDDSYQCRLMSIVDREIQRINELVTDFLWLAKGSRKPERLEETSIPAIISEVLALLQARDKIGSRHRIEQYFENASQVLIDPHHLRQILWNLLTNALEAMPDGGKLRLHVRPAGSNGAENSEVAVDVSDTGCGISEELRDRVFDPFFTTKDTGTGLGLSIVYQLVQNMGGRLEVAHHDGQGTTFSIFFPLSSPFPLAK
jgi:two-component system sensor histidine kinase PilS (NtrC family)